VLAGDLELLIERPLPPTLVWDYPTISGLARALAGSPADPGAAGSEATDSEAAGSTDPAATPDPAAPGPRPDRPAGDGIAVVGLGCRFPGGLGGSLTSPEAFWSFLLAGGDAVGEMPAHRWAAFDDGSAATGEALSAVTRWAAVLDDVAGFDAAFFGISAGEAAAMDPQQRMLLEVAWEALEHAGLPPASLSGSATGVFTGISATEYAHLTTADLSQVHGWTVTGAAASIAAGRISYLLDLRGPSLTVDTACSSSLLAVHLAVASLRSGESDLALAGGASLQLSPVITMTFDAGGGTSPDGRCRAFDARANGMVRGEGCGMVVLKRLADAQRDGDRVLGVIAGTAVNSDGRSNGLTAPSAGAQRDLLRAAYAAAGLSPDQVDYVEAHGTGTPLGDPIEARALGEVLGAARPAERPLLIGSVKSNIGHLEAAAGIAGLIKTVLALDRRRIPASLHFESPGPHLPLAELGLAVVAEPADWPPRPWPATAGVSAFGFSGTNVHVVLTAAPAASEPAASEPRVAPPAAAEDGGLRPGRPLRFMLSDRSPDRVQDQATQLAAWLDQRPPAEDAMADIAATLGRRRGRGPHQSAVVARDRAELLAGLRALGSGVPHPAVVAETAASVPGPGAVLVFSGYGSQWPGMADALAAAEPAFAAALAELEPLIRDVAGVSLTGAARDEQALRRVEHAQPVLFGIQVALARLWAAHGIRPAAVIGHSMGEVAAAVVSGALTAEQGAEVIGRRSRLLSRLSGAGEMAMVGLPADDVTELAAGLPGVHLAGLSSPVQTVLTGDAGQIRELARRAGARGAVARVLEVAGAGHSPQVEPLLGELADQLAGICPGPPQLRFYSTVHDDPRTVPGCDAAYWAANLRQPVRFGPAVAAAAADGLRAFVEVSPHALLGRALTETLQHEHAGPGLVTGTLRRSADSVLTFHAQLARLEAAGFGTPGPAAGTIIDLPPAPWRHERHWAERPARPAVTGHPLLGPHVELPGGGHAWRAPAAPGTLRGLGIGGHPGGVFPLSAAAEMVVAAACQAWDVPATDVAVTALRLEQLLALDADTVLTTTLDETGPPGHRAVVWIHARSAAGAWLPVASGDAALDPERRPARHSPAPAAGPAPSPRAPRSPAPEPRVTAIPAARMARGQRIPAQVLDRCLQAACASPDEIPVGAAWLRVSGDGAASGGSCEVTTVAQEDGTVTAAVRLSAGQPVLELSGVRLRRVDRSEIPVPYRDKLLERTWQQAELPPAATRPNARRWVMLDGPPANGTAPPLSAALAAALQAAGHTAGGPDRGGEAPGAAGRARAGDPDRGAELDAADLASAAGVVLVAPQAGLPPAAAARFVLDATRLAAALAARPGPPRLWIATAGALAAGPGEAGDPGLAAVRGLVRVLALEQPGLRATLADADPGAGPAAAAAALAAELIADAGDDEVAWRDGRRLAGRLTALAARPGGSPQEGPWPAVAPDGGARPRAARPVVAAGGSYIITGGYGGLGLVVARWLADRGAGRIVLSGRGGPPDGVRGQLGELTAAGADVRVVRGDVAQPGTAERLVAAAQDGGARLRGIVHAAGVFADALVGDVTGDSLARVWRPKAEGAWRLHEAAPDAGLDWFVLFSSAAALLGSPGQAAYAAANAWLDGFAAWRRAQGQPATSVNWGTWSQAGQAGGVAIRGIEPITPGEGVEALEALLAEDRAVAGVVRIDPAAAAAAYPEIAGLPFFGPLLGAAAQAAGRGDWPGPEAIRAAEPRRRQALVHEQVRSRVADVLGVPAGQLPADAPLADAGMDSLAALRIGNLIQHDLAITIDPAVLLAGGTLAGLQQSAAAALDAAAAALPPDAAEPAGPAAPPGAAGPDGAPGTLPDAGWPGGGARPPSPRFASVPAAPGAAGDPVEPRDAAERQVLRVAAEVLGAGPAGVTQDLARLGLSPAAEARIAARLATETGRAVDAARLWAAGRTIEAAAGTIRRADEHEAAILVRMLQPGGSRPPLLLAHPAGGTTGVYKMLAGLLGREQPVFGLERTTGEVGDRAARYAAVIRDRWAGGWILGGWSFGGALAYETARQLAAAGAPPPLVVLLDAAIPLPVAPEDAGAALATRFTAFARYLTRTYGQPVRLDSGELLHLDEDAQYALLQDRIAESGLTAQLSPAIRRHQETSHQDTRALERYAAGPYAGPVVLYRAEQDTPWAVRDPRYEITGETRGWDRLCRNLEVLPVAAHHLNLLDPPAVHAVAAHLQALLTTQGGPP